MSMDFAKLAPGLADGADLTQAKALRDHALERLAIGQVMDIGGASSQLVLDATALKLLADDADTTVAMAGQVGSQVKIRVGDVWLIAGIREQKMHPREHGLIVAIVDFLGEGDEELVTGRIHNFRRGVTRYPISGSPVYAATSRDLRQIYAADNRPHIEVGTVYPTRDTRAALYVDPLLGKHFALLGSTGTGKSTATALVLHRIVDANPEGHIVMIDPHGEYGAAFKGKGALFDVDNLAMPYWLMNFEEHCEVFVTSQGAERQTDCDILARCLLAARAKNKSSEGVAKLTVDSPVPYLLSDLLSILTLEMGKLDKATSAAPFLRLKGKIDELRADPRYNFMFSGMLVGDTLASFIAKIFRLPADGRPISIVDVSGVPSDVVRVVVAVLARMVFDFAIWSRDEPQRPVLLVCEEAHRYVPNERDADRSSVGRILSRIAKEGRKYGVSLGLITQRPSDLAESVLSQCGTIIAMRLNNERDQNFVKAAMPEGSRGFVAAIAALRNRECIVCGEGSAIPMRIMLDTLEEERRPASTDPLFSNLWRESGGEKEIVERVVRRWRSQGR